MVKKTTGKKDDDKGTDRLPACFILSAYLLSIAFYWAFVIPDDRVTCMKELKEFNARWGETIYHDWGKPSCDTEGRLPLFLVIMKSITAPAVDLVYIIQKLNSTYI